MILRALAAGYEPLSLLMEQREADSEKGREVLGRIMERSLEEIPVYVASNAGAVGDFRLQAGARHALCHAAEEHCRRWRSYVRECQTHRCPGKRRESHECRRNLPLRGSAGDRCGAVDGRLQRPVVPSGGESQHGDGIPGALDDSWGRKDWADRNDGTAA